MIYNKSNQIFEYKGKKYKAGDKIFATEKSAYKGLLGTITEIRTGKDKETDNTTPDIYCKFDAPVIPFFAEQLEQRFSELYHTPKKIDDIALDSVIMAPSMIRLNSELMNRSQVDAVYTVTEEWGNRGETGVTVEKFQSLFCAQVYMCKRIADEILEGNRPFNRRGDDDIVESSSDMFYEIYEEGWYNENNYSIMIKNEKVRGARSKKK